ncbi:MAG: hypothetical protein IJ228_03150, partial [Succinivibrio sp.]|nr:hypothetical protein [Succinivibrio sp.]
MAIRSLLLPRLFFLPCGTLREILTLAGGGVLRLRAMVYTCFHYSTMLGVLAREQIIALIFIQNKNNLKKQSMSDKRQNSNHKIGYLHFMAVMETIKFVLTIRSNFA